jgi:hypothetical protein
MNGRHERRADMSEEQAPESPQPHDGGTLLRLAKGPLAGPVLCRVVSMVLTRADWPVDRLHDVMLVCDALSTHAPDYSSDGTVAFGLTPREGEIELCVEELLPDGAESIVRDAMLPGVGNVLERIPKSLSVEPTDTGSRLTLVLSRN